MNGQRRQPWAAPHSNLPEFLHLFVWCQYRCLPPSRRDDVSLSGGEAFCCLLAAVLAQDGDGFAVDADGAGTAALGGAFDALAAYDGS